LAFYFQNDMFLNIQNKEDRIALVGLGYVGLPLALALAKKCSVIGFEIDGNRLQKLKNGEDPSRELEPQAFAQTDILFTDSLDELSKARFFIVAVPTPVDAYNQPDLKPLISATETVGKVLKKGDYVVYESTVYPGCTEEVCLPLLERISGLSCGPDFKAGYSPERINPGDKEHTLTNTVKIVSGSDKEALEQIARVYELVIEAGVHPAPNIKVAEMAKIIENTQRDVNIALMNELSIIAGRLGINIYDVIEAAGTKWNFIKFSPGLVGGHCIGVDPYYLVHKAYALKYHPQIIRAGRYVNDTMGGYIAKKLVKRIIATGARIMGCRILVMGITYKENVSDIRNSKVVDIINELKDFGVEVDVVDPFADSNEVIHEYGINLSPAPSGKYRAVVVAVTHDSYKNLSEEYIESLCEENGFLLDIKGIYRNKIQRLNYMSL